MFSIRTHNVLDYVTAAVLVLMPYISGFSEVTFARDAFLVVGFTLAGYSLLTDYRYSLSGVVPLGMHMTFDIVSGVFLMLAPMIYAYRDELSSFQYALHFASGLGTVALAIFTPRGEEPPVELTEDLNEDLDELVEPVRKAA